MFSLQHIVSESSLVSTSNNQNAQLYNWIQSCPDKEKIQQLLMNYAWLESNDKCTECGEEMQRKYLRYDTIGPYSDGTTLICKNCWEFNCEPTPANPNGIMDEKWPDHILPTYNNVSNHSSGKLRDKITGLIIGTVTQYNSRHHTGKVCFFGCPEQTEIGTLDPGCEVIDENNQIITYDPKIININPYKSN